MNSEHSCWFVSACACAQDGRLCILDWGLVTSIPKNLQLSFIEHIAHLTSHDYAKVPEDLVKLGFVPPGMEEVVRSSGTVEVDCLPRRWPACHV